MKIQSFEFSHIKAFKTLSFDLTRTSVLIGQNDHGKSSILKSIDIVMNRLGEETVGLGILHPDLAELLLPIFPVQAKARRISINYLSGTKKKQLHITVRSDFTFIVHETIARNAKTSQAAIDILKKIREANKFVLIPALRDASSEEFQGLFSRMLREHGLSKMIPQKAGGTPREYRVLKDIRDQVSSSIKPYINKELLPQIEKYFGFSTEHKLALKFDVDVGDVGEWIMQNLRLGFEVSENDEAILALSESGSGVQSGVLLALHRLEQRAASSPDVQFILAIEEPEAFLHPQRQKELYQDVLAAQTNNLRVLITTHSPYLVSETPFSKLGLVKKVGKYSTLHVPEIKNIKEIEMFDAYSDEVNAALFFAEKVIFVEGESDARVLKTLLAKFYGSSSHRISIISASGNQNFSPFLKMMASWGSAKIPHLVVTDFDSLTKLTDRALLVGAKAAGYSIQGEAALHSIIDSALDRDEAHFRGAADDAESRLSSAGLSVFIFTSDLEYSLISPENKEAAASILTSVATNGLEYSAGYDLNNLKRLIGSKGIPINSGDKAPFKKPYIHQKIANTIDLNFSHPDISRLLSAIDAL